jgi:hypothetical protein
VVLTVGFYAVDSTQVGHGTTGSIPNLLKWTPKIGHGGKDDSACRK